MAPGYGGNFDMDSMVNSVSVVFNDNTVPMPMRISVLYPYPYINISTVFNIKAPYVCSNNTIAHDVGIELESLHACPMASTEWEMIVPDVVDTSNATSYGPDNNAYNTAIRDGQWIFPNPASFEKPITVYRTPSTPDGSGRAQIDGKNWGSRHMPFDIQFGPSCSSLTITPPLMQHAFGGVLRILPISQDAAYPINYMPPGTFIDAAGDSSGKLYIAETPLVNFVENLVVLLCNGLNGATTRAGLETATGNRLGPLVSAANASNLPIWPNPYTWAFNGALCPRCNPYTFRHQKGFVIMTKQFL